MAVRNTTLIVPIIEPAVASVLERLEEMRGWPEGWNGYDALPPKPEAIAHAREWIQALYAEITAAGLPWIDPLVCASGEGEVSFEWWHGKRKITVYVSENTVEFVKVWGPRIFEDMDDGDIVTPKDSLNLWQWLTS